MSLAFGSTRVVSSGLFPRVKKHSFTFLPLAASGFPRFHEHLLSLRAFVKRLAAHTILIDTASTISATTAKSECSMLK